MTTTEFISVLLFFLLITFTSVNLGLWVIDLIKKLLKERVEKVIQIEIIGASILVGMGIIGYLSFLVGLTGHFAKIPLIILIILCLLASVKQAFSIFTSTLAHLKDLANEYRRGLIALPIIILTVATLGGLYLAAMQPPYATDELHYHLPQVKQIIDSQKISLNFGGHLFYGSIPKLMEIIFAIGSAISSYQLAHALNFAVFVGFLLIIFGVVRKFYGITAASFSILFLVWFDDFTWNATTGFIDSATTAFEISSLLFIITWFSQKSSKVYFYVSAILMGLAASMKYSPLPTALFIIAIIFAKSINDKGADTLKILKTTLVYSSISFLFGGFWYVKNFLKFQNPFYPLIFGHKGYPEIEFKGLVEAIQEFGPKTWSHFFELTQRYLSASQIHVFASIYTAPIIIFVKKQNKFHLTLFVYFLLYTIYWFFIATHQIRFLAPAIVAALILSSILVSKISSKILIFCFLAFLYLLYSTGNWSNFWKTKFHYVERQFALGNVSQEQFLTWQFGCQYSMISYLEKNNLGGAVVDNWSVWFAPSVSFFADKNPFQSYQPPATLPASDYLQDLTKQNIHFLYFNSDTKEKFLKSEDPIVIKSKNSKLPAETYLLRNAKLIFKDDKCYLYKITGK